MKAVEFLRRLVRWGIAAYRQELCVHRFYSSRATRGESGILCDRTRHHLGYHTRHYGNGGRVRWENPADA